MPNVKIQWGACHSQLPCITTFKIQTAPEVLADTCTMQYLQQ